MLYGDIDRHLSTATSRSVLTSRGPADAVDGSGRGDDDPPPRDVPPPVPVFEEHGRFDERFTIAGDYEFLLRELLSTTRRSTSPW